MCLDIVCSIGDRIMRCLQLYLVFGMHHGIWKVSANAWQDPRGRCAAHEISVQDLSS